MSLCYRPKALSLALCAGPILWMMSLSVPSLGQTRVGAATDNRQPLAPAPHGHHHVRGAYIVCPTPDVHSCHREFAHKHRAHAH